MALHHRVVIRYSTSVTYRTLCHATMVTWWSIASATDLRERFLLSRVFTLYSFLLFQGFPGSCSSTWKFSGLHADFQILALARIFVSITATQKRFICGRFYLRARASQSWNINLHRELVLQNISFEIFASYGVWILFAIGEHVTSLLS